MDAPEAIFFLLVLVLLLTVYFNGRARLDPIAPGKGGGIALNETGGGETPSAADPVNGPNPWPGMERVIASVEETNDGETLNAIESLLDAVDDTTGQTGGDSEGGLAGARLYALLHLPESGGPSGSIPGSGGPSVEGTSEGSSSESWSSGTGSLSSPFPGGYGRGGSLGSYPAATGQQPGMAETAPPSSDGEGSGGGDAAGPTGGIAGIPSGSGPASDPGGLPGPLNPGEEPGRPSGPVNPVPEPATLLLLCLGLAGIRAARSRGM